MVVQHSFIKDNEIYVKIWGDHGGGTFKLLLYLADLRLRTTEITKIGLTRFRTQINALQAMKSWRVMRYILPLFLEERNYQKNPTSNTGMPINLLAII